MNIAGEYRLPAALDTAYRLLQDPVLLAKCMPGCERLDSIGEDEYAMRMKMALASVSGLFDGKVKIADREPPNRFRLVVEGSGKIGFMKGEGLIALSPDESGSSVHYDGDVQVGGTIANVGQRLIQTTAKLLIKRFFDKMAKEAGEHSASLAGQA